MAETSCSALCFFSSIPFSVSPSRSTDSNASSLFFANFPLYRLSVSSSNKHGHHRHVSVRFAAKPSDSFNFFPWSDGDGDGDAQPVAIEWVQEERITLFTADGLIQIGGSVVPKRVTSSDKKQGRLKNSQRFQRFQESNYMDPNQVLCLGALFDIAATNGLDMGRRLCILGFCRSIEMLSDVVEDTVLEHGGEIVAAEKASTGGLHEKLTMTVAVPYLWGVPPASETLHLAVQSGGGIVEKIYWQWDFV